MTPDNKLLTILSITEEDRVQNHEGLMTPKQVKKLHSLLKHSLPTSLLRTLPRMIGFSLIMGLICTFVWRSSINNTTDLLKVVLIYTLVWCGASIVSFRTWLTLDAGPLLVREMLEKDLTQQRVKVSEGYYIEQLSHIANNKNIYRIGIGNAPLNSTQLVQSTSAYLLRNESVLLKELLANLPLQQKLRIYYAENSYALLSIELLAEQQK